MSLSRSPSPQRGGGWSSPGLTNPHSGPPSRRASPLPSYQNGGSREVTWASAQARSAEVKGYPSFQTRNQGFFGRHLRKLSLSLPRFGKNESGRGKSPVDNPDFLRSLVAFGGKLIWRFRARFAVIAVLLLLWSLFYLSRMLQ